MRLAQRCVESSTEATMESELATTTGLVRSFSINNHSASPPQAFPSDAQLPTDTSSDRLDRPDCGLTNERPTTTTFPPQQVIVNPYGLNLVTADFRDDDEAMDARVREEFMYGCNAGDTDDTELACGWDQHTRLAKTAK